jgi:glutamate/tyrosine decarboxylase-like PLP-dependent enzyme
VDGVEGCDSFATDLHKMLNVPYDSALVCVRDGAALHRSMSCAAPYVASAINVSTASSGLFVPALMPELANSRRARGVAAWAALQQLGTRGVAKLVDGCCDRAVRLAGLLQAGGATLVHPVLFNQALVHFGTDEKTSAVAVGVQLDGRSWIAAARYKDRTVIRLSVSSWVTTDENIDAAARAILECAARIG